MSTDTLRFTCLFCGDEQLVATDMQEGDKITFRCGQCKYPSTITAHVLKDDKWVLIEPEPPTQQRDALMQKMGEGIYPACGEHTSGDFHALLDNAMKLSGLDVRRSLTEDHRVYDVTVDVVESTTEDKVEQVKED